MQPKYRVGDSVSFYGRDYEVSMVRVDNDDSYHYRIEHHVWVGENELSFAPQKESA